MSDIDTVVVVVGLKALDPEWPIREAIGAQADIARTPCVAFDPFLPKYSFRFAQSDTSYAASRRVISAKAARPSSVNEYGASNSGPVFFTKCFRLRYCMSAFIDLRGILSTSVTSLMRSAPESRIVESTLRTRSDSTGSRGTAAQRAD